MGDRELNLDGAEISVLKAIGLSGSEVNGKELASRCSDMVDAELIDTIKGLMMLGYVVSDSSSFHDSEDMERITFRVNSGYLRDLKEAMNPQPTKAKSKRVRRE